MKIKDDFHHLIDSIENEELLKHYYNLIQGTGEGQNGRLWSNLTEEEKDELLIAHDESFNKKNLLSHEEVKSQYTRWLKP